MRQRKRNFKDFFQLFFALETQIKDKKEKPNFFSAKKIDFRARASEKKKFAKNPPIFRSSVQKQKQKLNSLFQRNVRLRIYQCSPGENEKEKKLQKKSLKKNFSRR
jgi:hypothetical protein